MSETPPENATETSAKIPDALSSSQARQPSGHGVDGPSPPPVASPAHTVREKTVSPAELPGSVELPPEDQVRRGLAFFVLWIVAGVIVAGMALTALTPLLGLEPERIQSTVQFFFTATITLAGTVFGFYFATRNR